MKLMNTAPLRHALLCAGAIALTACATATPYQPASQPGAFDGFSEQMIENDRARISFAGNSLTERDTVENYLLYRAAEKAVERGYDWFELQERDTEAKTRTRVSSLGGPRFGARAGLGFYDPFFGYDFYRPGFGWSGAYRFSHFGGFRHRRGFGFNRFYGPYSDPFFNDIDVREITKYRATAEVKFGSGPKPLEDDRVFDAREVIENLGPTLRLPETEA
ncbi:MAG: hypothetical protein WBG08_05935 [Litorimonas sp.]